VSSVVTSSPNLSWRDLVFVTKKATSYAKWLPLVLMALRSLDSSAIAESIEVLKNYKSCRGLVDRLAKLMVARDKIDRKVWKAYKKLSDAAVSLLAALDGGLSRELEGLFASLEEYLFGPMRDYLKAYALTLQIIEVVKTVKGAPRVKEVTSALKMLAKALDDVRVAAMEAKECAKRTQQQKKRR